MKVFVEYKNNNMAVAHIFSLAFGLMAIASEPLELDMWNLV
jgi:hypothetical protein